MIFFPQIQPSNSPFLTKMVEPVRIASMDQIELFNHLLYFKPFNCVQTINSNT